MQHIDELTGSPIVGKYYLVPTVKALWFNSFAEYPVIGPRHNDKQDLEFEPFHFHIDARFISKGTDDLYYWRAVLTSPVSETGRGGQLLNDKLISYERKWLCKRQHSPFVGKICDMATDGKSPNFMKHVARYAGANVNSDKRGLVCPHRNVSLANQPVADDGVVICPLHFLQICTRSNRVLSADEVQARLKAGDQ
ncbi:MAG: Rieske 2Fe-2S domain-containing protein [Lentilitoribacter sp.]